jgi:hypothetical protein
MLIDERLSADFPSDLIIAPHISQRIESERELLAIYRVLSEASAHSDAPGGEAAV